jgi:cytochrome P450
MTTLVSTAGDVANVAAGLGAAYKPFEHHGMYEFFARARTDEPVFFCPAINYWVVTRREDILPLLQDAARFSADIALAPATPLTAEAVAILKAGMGAEPTQVNCDPPKHTRIRQVAGRFLNAKRYAALEPDIRRLAREALDALQGRSEIDLVADLVYEFPARVLFLLMGIPAEDAPRIKQWADYRLLMTFGDLSPAEQRRGAEDMVAYWRYCVELVADRKQAPRDDYASFLIAHRAEVEPPLSDNEIVSLVFGLLLAGHETTTNLSANALLAHEPPAELGRHLPGPCPHPGRRGGGAAHGLLRGVLAPPRTRGHDGVRRDHPGRGQHPAGTRLGKLRRSAVPGAGPLRHPAC